MPLGTQRETGGPKNKGKDIFRGMGVRMETGDAKCKERRISSEDTAGIRGVYIPIQQEL